MDLKKYSETKYDAVIIGSGFGGSMTAEVLVNAGMKVLMVERGDWVKRGPENWAKNASIDLTPHYTQETPLKVLAGGNKKVMGLYSCVGGPSVFYGGVSFRFREADFNPPAEIVNNSGAKWPIRYQDLEPFYSHAENILGVSGEANVDPTEPQRSAPYPQSPSQLSKISQKVGNAAKQLKLNPFRLPLAINYGQNGRDKCISCTTCDTFACAIGAKNDLATVLLPKLVEKGLTILPRTVAANLIHENGRLTGVECISRDSGERAVIKGDQFILSAGAMASPHILMASGLQKENPAGDVIGRHLMRHVNAIVFGVFPGTADREQTFHKQLGIMDYYFGHPSIEYPKKKLGSIQQLQTPPAGLVEEMIPKPFGKIISPTVKLLTGLLTIAEDQPQYENRLQISSATRDKFGLPQLEITHHYSKRDIAALKALITKAKKVLKLSGALFHYVHHIRTFSHAVGTVRMGEDPSTSVLDHNCQFRGMENLFVVDASFMPTSAGLNPSLTISANALRVAEHIKNAN